MAITVNDDRLLPNLTRRYRMHCARCQRCRLGHTCGEALVLEALMSAPGGGPPADSVDTVEPSR
jgi:hypothetical protein